MRYLHGSIAALAVISLFHPAHAGAPTWCDGYTPSRIDAVASVKSALRKTPEFDSSILEAIAKARCDKPTDPERERLFAEWRSAYQAVSPSTDADFDDLMAYVMKSRGERIKLEQEQCKAVEPESGITPEQDAEAEALTRLLDCSAANGTRGFSDLPWWLDRTEVTEVQRLAIINRCLPQGNWADDKPRGELAFCWTDLDKLDRAKFDKELAALKLNAHGRVTAVAIFAATKVKAEQYVAKYRKLAAKDPSWKRLLDAPQVGWDAWVKQREHNRAAYEVVRAFQDKLRAGSKSAVAGCDDKLRKLVFAQLATKKPASLTETHPALKEPVGYELAVALLQCYSASGKYLEAWAMGAILFSHRINHHRGPRVAGYYATLDALNAIRDDQPNFVLDRLQYLSSGGDETIANARGATANKVHSSTAQGQIAKVRAGTPTVTVSFKTVRWKDPSYDCTPTNRIERIDDGGNPIYVQNCKLTGYESKSSTEAPIEVPSAFAAGLKPGQMGIFRVDTQGTKRTGIPEAIYADANKKKLLGMFGVFW